MSRNWKNPATHALGILTYGTAAWFGAALGHGQAVPRITGPIDEAARVPLRHSVHPFARPENDLGPVDDAASGRMLLMLKRSPEQDKALHQFLDEQQDASSPNFHKWLTPEQFGEKYGAAEADIQTVTGYLASHGFKVGRTFKNKSLVEVIGTPAQMRETFHVEMHRYSVAGHEFTANAGDPTMPAALAPVVAGFASLNNIDQEKLVEEPVKSVPVTIDLEHHRVKPEYTPSSPVASWNYLLTATDIQTLYSIPVSNASLGNGGQGVTEGVIGDAQIDIKIIALYQALGGAGSSVPTEIVDGEDPAIFNSAPSTSFSGNDALQGILHLEVVAAAAPNASLNYYTSASTLYDTGLNFAIIRAVEDNAAQVLTLAFAGCEANLTPFENYFIYSAWMQAAAQGQTVVVKAGNSGAAGCDVQGTSTSTGGLAVNGYGSTPYNTAVGATDFYYGSNGAGYYWNATNGTNGGSVKGYIPEQVWNGSIQTYNSGSLLSATYGGGGGLSSAGSIDGVTSAPYAMPSWQAAAQANSGSSGANARGVPDVALFGGDNNQAAYALCLLITDCSSGLSTVNANSGTGAAAGTFAGILAEVIAKYGRQGNINPTLYSMASTYPSAFNDVTLGNNSVACTAGTGCSNGYLEIIPGIYYYQALSGYDLASGLGSVNATNLITHWTPPATKTSSTSLAITNWPSGTAIGSSVLHGTPLSLTATVTGSSGTPTGNVGFTTNSTLPSYGGIYADPLIPGTAANTAMATSGDNMFLPGGSYTVTAQYYGDSTFQSSSGTQSVTVTPETSQLLYMQENYPCGSSATNFNDCLASSIPSVPFGTNIQVVVEPFSATNVNNVSTPTGTVSAYPAATTQDPTFVLPLSSEGTATMAANMLGSSTNAGGQLYAFSFRYSGDPSYQTSNTISDPYEVYVTRVTPTMSLASSSASALTNEPVTLTATLQAQTGTAAASNGIAPSGTVTFSNNATPVTLVPGFNTSGQAISVATEQVPAAQVPAGGLTVTAAYSGDSNYVAANGSAALSLGATNTYTSSLALSLSTGSPVSTTGAVTLAATVTQTGGAVGGNITLYANGAAFAGNSFTIGTTGSYTIPLSGGYLPFASGQVTLTAVYTANASNVAPSANYVTLTVTDNRTTGDFSLTTDTATQTLTNSSNVAFFKIATTDLGNMLGLGAPIALSCAVPAGSNLTCTLGSGGTSSTTVTIGSGSGGSVITQLAVYGRPSGGTGALRAPTRPRQWWLMEGGPALACILLLGVPARRKGLQGTFAVLVCAALAAGCGANRASLAGSELTGGNLLQTNAATANYTKGLAANSVAPGNYTVIVTATSTTNAVVTHNISVNVTMGSASSLALANGTYAMTAQGSISSNGTMFLTDPGASTASGTNLVQNPADGTNDQAWTFTYQGNGYYTIQNAGNLLYLTDPGGAVGSTAKVTQQTATGDGTQLWTLNPIADTFEVVNAQSGGVLDDYQYRSVAGTQVICYSQKQVYDDINQTWYIQ